MASCAAFTMPVLAHYNIIVLTSSWAAGFVALGTLCIAVVLFGLLIMHDSEQNDEEVSVQQHNEAGRALRSGKPEHNKDSVNMHRLSASNELGMREAVVEPRGGL